MNMLETFSNTLKDTLNDTQASGDAVINILKKISEELKSRLLFYITELEYVCLAGASGSLIAVLENKNLHYNCKIDAARCLHYLTYIDPDQLKLKKPHPSEVITAIQKVCIQILLQGNLPDSNISKKQYSHLVLISLSILYNLVLFSPEEVLGSSIIKAAYPFVFHDLQRAGEKLDFTNFAVPFSSQMQEQDTDNVKTYTNRNRRKRLRRKKALPSSLTFKSSSEENVSLFNPKNSLQEKSKASVFVAHQVPPLPLVMSNISLKPQWMTSCSKNNLEDTSTVKSSTIPSESYHDNNSTISENIRKNCSLERTYLSSDYGHLSSDFNVETVLSFGENLENQTSIDVKVRQHALSTINAVITKVDPQNKFIFWPQMMCQSPSIMTSILRDPSSTVRMTALQVVTSFLIDSQKVLSMATDEKPGCSYTALGKQLGSSIRELHRCLILALLSEKISSSIVRILKTMELLVENVNYSTLKPGLLTKMVTHVKYFLRYKDAVVRANAFSFMVSMLMIKPQFSELKNLLTRYHFPLPSGFSSLPIVRSPSPCDEQMPDEKQCDEDVDFESQMEHLNLLGEESFSSDSGSDLEGMTSTSMVSWLVQRCMDSLLLKKNEHVQGIYIQVQLQSLKVLSVLVSEHLSIIKSDLPLIQQIIRACCELKPTDDTQNAQYASNSDFDQSDAKNMLPIDLDANTQFVSPDPEVVGEHAFLLLGSLFNAIKAQLEKKHKLETDAICVTPELALQLWLWAFQHPLLPLMEMWKMKNKEHENLVKKSYFVEEYNIKPLAAAANVLSHLCSCVLQNVGEPILNDILKTVDLLLHHEEAVLQHSAIRIMAIIVAYSPIQEHAFGPKLISSTMEIITVSLEQKYSNVNKDRLLASWALANIVSAIAVYRNLPEKSTYKYLVNKETMLRTLRSALSGCKDKDKIRPHAVRCTGNAIALLNSSLICDSDIAFEVNLAISTLIECCQSGNNMKMRWNACQALGTVLSNRILCTDTASWRPAVLKTLCSLVECFKNYKVRIQACSALCCPNSRSTYAQEYYSVWKSVLQGFEDSLNISDYQKIQHRDDLANQLCVTLCHLICLLELVDLDGLSDLLLRSQDTVKILLKKANKNLPPERVTCILKAIQKIKALLNADTLTASQEQNISLLEEIFSDIK